VERCPQRLEAVCREGAACAMNATPGAKTFEQRQRQPKGRSAKPRVPGTDTHGNYRRRLRPFNVSANSAPTGPRKPWKESMRSPGAQPSVEPELAVDGADFRRLDQ